MSIPLKIKVKVIYFLNEEFSSQETVIVEKKRSESMLHIVLKLFALLYFFKSTHQLILEPKVRVRGFRPDLVSYRPSEIPSEVEPEVDLWIECKKVKISKLKTLAQYLPFSQIYWFHLDHMLRKKRIDLEGLSEIEIIGVNITKRDLAILENSLITQSPIWNVKQDGGSNITITTLNSEICIEFINIKTKSDH